MSNSRNNYGMEVIRQNEHLNRLVTELRTQLAEVTAERDRMRESLVSAPCAWDCNTVQRCGLPLYMRCVYHNKYCSVHNSPRESPPCNCWKSTALSAPEPKPEAQGPKHLSDVVWCTCPRHDATHWIESGCPPKPEAPKCIWCQRDMPLGQDGWHTIYLEDIGTSHRRECTGRAQ